VFYLSHSPQRREILLSALKEQVGLQGYSFSAGLTGSGRGVDDKAAGSDTSFAGLFFVASHQEEVVPDEPEVEGAITKREDVSPADKKRAEKEYGDVKYADEKNKKYPIDTEEHVRAALAYLSMPKNAAKYSSEEAASMMSKIHRAAKKLGVDVSDDKKSKSESSKESDMADKEKEETPEEEKKESPAEEKKENEAEGGQLSNLSTNPPKAEACDTPAVKAEDYAEMSKKVADLAAELEANKVELKSAQDAKVAVEAKYGELETQVTTIKAALDEAQNTIKAHRTNELKSKLVGSVMDEAEFTKRAEELLGLPDTALELLARASKRESTEARPEDNRLAASEKVPDNGKVNIIL
jgi:hypothetical protein